MRFALLLFMVTLPEAAEPPAIHASTSSSAPVNYVLELDGGTNSYVELPPNILNDLTNATVELWLKPRADSPGPRFFSYGSYLRDMGIEAYVSSSQEGAMPGVLNRAGVLRCFLQDANRGVQDLRQELSVLPGEWMHVAVVLGSQGFKLYLNGVVVGESAYRGSFAAIGNGQQFRLGRSVVSDEAAFAGQLDDVRVWRTARTEAQLRENLARRLSGAEPGLVGYRNFDDGTARDSTSGRHDGILRGNARIVPIQTNFYRDFIPAFIISGRATDEAGHPLRDAIVRLMQGNERVAKAQTPLSGEIPPGGVAAQPHALPPRSGKRRSQPACSGP